MLGYLTPPNRRSLSQARVAPGPRAILEPVDRQATMRRVIRLAGPAIAQQLLHTLVFLADRAMLGHYGAAALASMQINGPLLWSVFHVLAAFGVGTLALVGRAVGAGDAALASAVVRTSLILAFCLGGIAGLLGIFAIEGCLALFPQADPAIREAAGRYLAIVFPCAPFYLLSFTGWAAMQAAGDTRTPFKVTAVGNLLNIGLNAGLIFGRLGLPELGVQGAALASASTMLLQSVVLLGLLARRKGAVTWRGYGGEGVALRRVIRVSAAAFGERLAQQLGYLVYATMVGALGGMAMAAHQGLLSIEALAFLSADGFGIAAAAIVAQRLGAGRPQEAALGARLAVGLAIGLLGSLALVFCALPELLLATFAEEPRIVALGVPCLYIAALAQPFMAIAVVLSEALRGAGATQIALGVTLLGGLVVRVGATGLFAFAFDLGLIGAWLGSTLDWAVRAALLTLAFRRGAWRAATV